MTISSATRTAGPFTGTGALVGYPFSFKVFSGADLAVEKITAAGVRSMLVLSSDYSVAVNADQDVSPGGTINLTTALPTGATLTATTAVSATQGASLSNGGAFLAKVIEGALDRLTIVGQQLVGLFGRTLRVPEIGGMAELPAASIRANNLLSFDSGGNPIAVAPGAGSATALAILLASAQGASHVGYLPVGATSVGNTIQDTLKASISNSILDYGGNANPGTTDMSAAIAYAISQSQGRDLVFTPGEYLLTVKRRLRYCLSQVHEWSGTEDGIR